MPPAITSITTKVRTCALKVQGCPGQLDRVLKVNTRPSANMPPFLDRHVRPELLTGNICGKEKTQEKKWNLQHPLRRGVLRLLVSDAALLLLFFVDLFYG